MQGMLTWEAITNRIRLIVEPEVKLPMAIFTLCELFWSFPARTICVTWIHSSIMNEIAQQMPGLGHAESQSGVASLACCQIWSHSVQFADSSLNKSIEGQHINIWTRLEFRLNLILDNYGQSEFCTVQLAGQHPSQFPTHTSWIQWTDVVRCSLCYFEIYCSPVIFTYLRLGRI